MTVYCKMWQILLENASAILLQNATEVYSKCDSIITNCYNYYKLRQFCHKVRQLLQNATFITICDSKWLHVYGGRLIGQ